MSSKSQAGDALKCFGNDWGYPTEMIVDGGSEQVQPGTEFRKICNREGISFHQTEPGRKEQNPAERAIRELRKKWYRVMQAKRVPRRLWDYGMKWCCEIMQRTPNSHFRLQGRTPCEQVTGETPDISEYLDFGFYDWVHCDGNAGLGETMLGRWLGVSHRVGNSMTYYILQKNGTVVSRSTVSRVTDVELMTTNVKTACQEFDRQIADRLRDENHVIPPDVDAGGDMPRDWTIIPELDQGDPDYEQEFQAAMSDPTIPEVDDIKEVTPDTATDPYLNVEIALPRSDDPEWRCGRVVKRAKGIDGEPVGTANDNPMLDTRVYEVEFPDGHLEELAANTIAECMYAQVDSEGHRHVLLDEIVDHRKTPDALPMDDAFITQPNGVQKRRKTTAGWELLAQWKDGSTNWIPLKDLKNSHPVQVAEYAVGNKISKEPAFAWWVPHTLRKRNSIIAKVKSRYWLKTHKFGIELPKSVEHALELDRKNGNDYWKKAIDEEMKNVRPAFQVHEGTVADLVGYQKIRCHMIFDIKMGENFRRKARFVAGGHVTHTPPEITYSSVVTRDSVRIAFLVAALNGLKVMSADIQNAYLTADCREKIFTIAGPEFGSEQGSIMIVKKALYGLKSAGGAFWALLREVLTDLQFVPSQADQDVWIRPAVKDSDGTEYYEYFLTYVDDCVSISERPKEALEELRRTFKLKNDKIEPPKDFLGAQVEEKDVYQVTCWTMSSKKYVEESIKNVEDKLKTENQVLANCKTPSAQLQLQC